MGLGWARLGRGEEGNILSEMGCGHGGLGRGKCRDDGRDRERVGVRGRVGGRGERKLEGGVDRKLERGDQGRWRKGWGLSGKFVKRKYSFVYGGYYSQYYVANLKIGYTIPSRIPRENSH